MSVALLPAVESVVARARELVIQRSNPVAIAIDGRSGAGKSTLAALIAAHLGATVIPLDDFFSAQVPSAQWDAWTPAERAAHVIDWGRVRTEALDPLRAGQVARWHAFDFAAGPRSDGTYPMSDVWTERTPRAVVILDGAYSARPELRDAVDLAVLVEVPDALRRSRLRDREDAAFLKQWHARWDAAEEHNFNSVCPRESFDIVVFSDGVGDAMARVAADRPA